MYIGSFNWGCSESGKRSTGYHHIWLKESHIIWGKVFKNRLSKICGRQPLKNLKCMVCLSRLYRIKYFKGCRPQILLGPILNILTHIYVLHPFDLQNRGSFQNQTSQFKVEITQDVLKKKFADMEDSVSTQNLNTYLYSCIKSP